MTNGKQKADCQADDLAGCGLHIIVFEVMFDGWELFQAITNSVEFILEFRLM